MIEFSDPTGTVEGTGPERGDRLVE